MVGPRMYASESQWHVWPKKGPGDDQKGHFSEGTFFSHKNQEDQTLDIFNVYIITSCKYKDVLFWAKTILTKILRFGNFEVSTTPAAVLRGYWSKLRDSHWPPEQGLLLYEVDAFDSGATKAER